MKKNYHLIIFVVLSLLLLGGCRTAPVMNVDDTAIALNGNYTLDDVKKAIVRAGASLGWQMKVIEPGHIVGTLLIRDHMAKIDITFDRTKYSIHYKDSTNLKYDGTNIHSNYNGWIERLYRNIQVQLGEI
jgi:hypothetical protein